MFASLQVLSMTCTTSCSEAISLQLNISSSVCTDEIRAASQQQVTAQVLTTATSSLVSPIFCLHYFPQAKGSQCQTRAIYSCSSSGVATNSLFLPCWFSANKGAVLMQDKNILSSSVSNIWFQLETNYESSK